MILVTGATGFTGSFVVERLIAKGFDFACFVRPTSDTTSLKLRGIDIRVGTLDDYESFFRALRGVDTLVNIASLGFGHAPNIVKAAEQARDGGLSLLAPPQYLRHSTQRARRFAQKLKD